MALEGNITWFSKDSLKNHQDFNWASVVPNNFLFMTITLAVKINYGLGFGTVSALFSPLLCYLFRPLNK